MPLTLTRRGEIWYLRGTVAGHHLYESTGLRDRRQAEARRIRREAELLDRHAYGRAATATFAEAALTYMRAGGEARYLAPLIAHFGPATRLAEIDNDRVTACAAALYPTAAPATINRQVITPISAVMRLAAADGLVDARSFRRRKAPRGRTRWLTPAEAEALIAAADPRTAVLVEFLLGTGLRTHEALELQIADLHLATAEAWVWRSKTVPRMVRFPDRTVRALARALQGRDTGAVFLTPKGQPYKLYTGSGGYAATAFNTARAAAGLGPDVTPHVCRHTWATWFHAATRDFGALMDLGGWHRADTANIYRKLAPRDLASRLTAAGWDFDSGAETVQTTPAFTTRRAFSVVK
jgi:integrase